MKAVKATGIMVCSLMIVSGVLWAQTAFPAVDLAADMSAEPAAVSEDIAEVMTASGDLTATAEALAKSGADAIVAAAPEGATIFAPVDGSVSGPAEIADSITDYIVPGILNAEDLAISGELTSMSGSKIVIASDADSVTVNGVPLADMETVRAGDVVVYKLSAPFPVHVAVEK